MTLATDIVFAGLKLQKKKVKRITHKKRKGVRKKRALCRNQMGNIEIEKCNCTYEIG